MLRWSPLTPGPQGTSVMTNMMLQKFPPVQFRIVGGTVISVRGRE